MPGFWIYLGSGYTTVLNMPGLHRVLKMPEYAWIIYLFILYLLFIYLFISFFNVDTFSSNTLLIKIAKLYYFVNSKEI